MVAGGLSATTLLPTHNTLPIEDQNILRSDIIRLQPLAEQEGQIVAAYKQIEPLRQSAADKLKADEDSALKRLNLDPTAYTVDLEKMVPAPITSIATPVPSKGVAK